MNLISIRVNNIQCDGEPRGSAKELAELVESIREIGLLQPIVLNSKHEIIAGRRRLAACREAGLSHVAAVVCQTLDDAKKAILGERDENTCRVGLKPTEMKELADKIRALDKPEAAENQKAGLNRGKEKSEKTPGKSRDGNFPSRETGSVDDKAAEAAGTSRRTLGKIDEVVESGDEKLIEEMDSTGKVDPVHKKLKEKEKEPATDPLKEAADTYCAGVREMGRVLDEARRKGEELSKCPVGVRMHWQSILHHIATAKGSMNAGMPSKECPYCDATGKAEDDKACKGCKGFAYVDLSTYKAGGGE